MNNNLYLKKESGVLIVFEGISGCGKSENVKKLIAFLNSSGYKNTVVEWNSRKSIRRLTAFLLRNNLLTPNVFSILQWISFIYDYFAIILPAYKKGHVIIADRYVYTGITRDRVNRAGKLLGRLVMSIVKKPDILYFCDVDPVVCSERIKCRGKVLFHTNKIIMRNKLLKDKNLYYLKKLRYEYLRLLGEIYYDNSVNIYFIEDEEAFIENRTERFLISRYDKGYAVN